MHPREALLGPQAGMRLLPVCDHYSGVHALMVKSLALQREYIQEFGQCVFDVTLDCEDGAPVGGEKDHANMVAEHVLLALNAPKNIAHSIPSRVGIRIHPVAHPAFENDVQTIVGSAGRLLSYIMVPKVESQNDVDIAVAAIDSAMGHSGVEVPIHVLIESSLAVHRVFEIAAHPRVESVSFGLMDFVASHGGAIPADAMQVTPTSRVHGLGQFQHPLVLRAKTEISSACHAFGKVPSHCVVTEISDLNALESSARTAANALGFQRMWSIHPSQIRPILMAFAPKPADVDLATEVIVRAQEQQWAPIAIAGQLHDRASYRYFWHVLERAHLTGVHLPKGAESFF